MNSLFQDDNRQLKRDLYETKISKHIGEVYYVTVIYYDHRYAMHHFKSSNAPNLAHAIGWPPLL